MMPLTVVDIFPGYDFSGHRLRGAAAHRLAATGRSGFLDPTQFPTAAAAKRMLDLLRQDGVAPVDYGPLLQRYYLLTATRRPASISRAGTGARGRRQPAEPDRVVPYYGQLFLAEPRLPVGRHGLR